MPPEQPMTTSGSGAGRRPATDASADVPADTPAEDGDETVQVDLGARSYDIVVGAGLLDRAGTLLAPVLGGGPTVIVTDEIVAGLHLPVLTESLAAADRTCETVILPPGEQTKSFRHLEELLDALIAADVDRTSTVIAFGGGVIGDLAGLAAALVLRGVDYVQIPTTLLAQVDSSVGGKTAIDTHQGKNLVGAFYQPRMVLADIDVLDSLPRRELLAGYAEIVKYGLIGDAGFFAWLEEHAVALLAGDRIARRNAVAVSCRAKAAVVAADEHEAGARALLNLGHSFAHALEAEAGYGDALLHGEAVAAGMVMAFDLSVALDLCPADDAARLRRHFAAVGLSAAPPPVQGLAWDAARLLARMGRDKKVRDGRKTLILARGIGEAFASDAAEDTEILNILEQAVTMS